MKKVKTLTKVEAFNKSTEDFHFAMMHVNTLVSIIKENGDVAITDSLSISARSSNKQYIYAISILNNQILAAKELGIDYTDIVQKKEDALTIRSLSSELEQWKQYADQLHSYMNSVEYLLSDDEKFSMLEYPKK
jgi:hypothetical protein